MRIPTALALILIASVSSAITLGQVRLGIDDLYFHRDQGANLASSIAQLDDLIKSHGSPDLYWMRCRSMLRRGEKRDKKSEKLADFDAARADCAKSVELDPTSAEAHFWYGVVMGRWGETKGILKALFLIKPIKKEMNEVLRLDPGHGGAHRVLGEILWQVPGFAGGDKKAALAQFEAAVRLSPDHTSNYQPLAEAYLHYDRKDDAVKVLKQGLAVQTPADPAAAPDDRADLQALLDKTSR